MPRKLPDDFPVPISLAKTLAQTANLTGTIYALLERAYTAGWNAGITAAEERFSDDFGYNIGDITASTVAKDILKCVADLERNYPLQLDMMKDED